MKRLVLEPSGWQCTLEECPAGLFVYENTVGFKSEYRTNGIIEVFCDSGEVFWGGVNSTKERDKLIVQPVVTEWEEYEE